jgi:hypothetical protein
MGTHEMEQLSTAGHAAIGISGPSLAGDIDSPALRGLLAHWQQRRGRRSMPARGDLAEETLTAALGELILFELSCARTAGGDAAAAAARSELTAGMAAPFHEVMRSGRPMYRGRGEARGAAERLLLPLSADGRRVDTILVGVPRGR